jgi:uncharacterized protein YlxP (DUF503 family)
MTVGTVELLIHLPGCRSLKDTRSRLKRLIAGLRHDFNVSVAEVDKNDLHQTALLAVAVVSNDTSFANAVLSQVVARVERETTMYLQDHRLEFR